MGLKFLQKWLVFCLLIVVAMAMFCALELCVLPDVAFAQADKYDVVITATDYSKTENTWAVSISCGDQRICEPFRGKFITGDSTAVIYRMDVEIRAWLTDTCGINVQGDSAAIQRYCNLSFVFPEKISAEPVYSEVAYTQNICFDATINNIEGDFEPYFEYKKKDGSDATSQRAQYDYQTGNYTLSTNNMEYGEYLVRLIANDIMNFELDENKEHYTYPISRYSEWFEISVKQAVPNLPSYLAIQSVEYGTTLAGMDDNANNDNNIRKAITVDGKTNLMAGTFRPSDKQTDKFFDGKSDIDDILLDVSDESVIVVYDFVPADKNYAIMQVKVAIKMVPKVVNLYIKEAYSLLGEQLVVPEYFFMNSNPLAGDDTVDDLGIYFEYVNKKGEHADGSVAGKYLSVAKSSNPNYTIKCWSADNQFVFDGANYWVYNNKIDGILNDGIKFWVYTTWEMQDGVRVEMSRNTSIDESLVVEDKVFVCAYRITFFNKDGSKVEPQGDYVVNWEKNPRNAKWVSAYEGGFSFVKADPEQGIVLGANQNTIYFFADKPTPKSLVALYAVLGALAAVAFGCVCTVVASAIRRKLICKKNYKNYVYEYEMTTQSADCVDKAQSISQNTPQSKSEKTAVKKSRHGKKNKQINGTKRDSKQ